MLFRSRKIVQGSKEDTVLQPFDIIDVASRGGGKRKFSPMEVESRSVPQRGLVLRIVD